MTLTLKTLAFFPDLVIAYRSAAQTMHLSQDTAAVDGATDYGNNVVEGLKKEEKLEQSSVQNLSKEQDHVLKTFRLLIADLCQQFGGGHPGYVACSGSCSAELTFSSGAIGMAAIGVALWRYVMRYAPHTPTYFNRDRFVLSNGKFAESMLRPEHQLIHHRPYMPLSIHFPPPHRV